MPENIPVNSVLVSSRHYADLVESDVTLNVIRNVLIDRLRIFEYKLRPEIEFSGAGMEDVIKVLFPEQYAKRSSSLISEWKKNNPDKAEDD